MEMKSITALVCLSFSMSSCDDTPTGNDIFTQPETMYATAHGQLTYQQAPVWFRGVNAMHTFGLGDQSLLDEWEVAVVREFIGNLREQPIIGAAIQGTDGAWLHPLEDIVAANRAHHRITVLCPFGWVNAQGKQTLLTGLNPSAQGFYDDYKLRMRQIAAHFAGEPDVWLEVWNEPYHWNNEHGYTHDLWLIDMVDMLTNLRSVGGFDNMVLIPGNEQGQSEAAILAKGAMLLEGQYNVLFDLHAYEKWLNDAEVNATVARIAQLQDKGFPLIFGEVGVINASGLMPVMPFLEAATLTRTSTCAWLWNRNSADQNALLTEDGLPNDQDNLSWGSTYKAFMLR